MCMWVFIPRVRICRWKCNHKEFVAPYLGTCLSICLLFCQCWSLFSSKVVEDCWNHTAKSLNGFLTSQAPLLSNHIVSTVRNLFALLLMGRNINQIHRCVPTFHHFSCYSPVSSSSFSCFGSSWVSSTCEQQPPCSSLRAGAGESRSAWNHGSRQA